MDERTLRAFTKVADLKSFTKAATELGYVQSTISNQIKQLECELGFPLFDRIDNLPDLPRSGIPFLC